MANTEKQNEVLQEVKTDEVAVEQNVEQKQEVPKFQAKVLDSQSGNFKIKLKDKVNSIQNQKTEEQPVDDKPDVVEEVAQEEQEEQEVILKEVSQDQLAEEDLQSKDTIVNEVPSKPEQPQVVVPENLQELVKFMEETGGSLEDYSRLNADYSNIDDTSILKEYYKNTKPHLDIEEINFLIEDNFEFDEDIDESRNIKKKKLAFKEEIVKARKHLTGLKDQYYKEVKLGSKLTGEQKEAVSFYDKYKQERTTNSEIQKQQFDRFQKSTDNVFNDKFEGFDFNVGDKTYRFNVNNAKDVKDYQSDISNFVREFLDEKDMMKDAKGYHKALYAGKNVDKIVKHFYNQGKADAIKENAMSAKNIDMSSRTAAPVVDAGGMKYKVIGGDNSSSLKFKIRK
tara:strand:- start:642 stop:1829 length:1188 start_codon:yes stop_codon:yes gene_type:complete